MSFCFLLNTILTTVVLPRTLLSNVVLLNTNLSNVILLNVLTAFDELPREENRNRSLNCPSYLFVIETDDWIR